MRLIDTHCHLNLPEAFPEPGRAIDEARAAGVDRLVVVGLDTATSEAAIRLAERHEGIFVAVGWHPNYSAHYTRRDLDDIAALLRHPKAVAVGETGLDNHWQEATPEQQMQALTDHLDLAASVGKAAVLHCREAYPELLQVLEARPRQPLQLHCFSGSEDDARRAVALGALLGFDGPITYRKKQALRDLAAGLAEASLLIETDSPFLAPEPFRGKPNEPARLVWVNRALAQARGVSEQASAESTTRNAVAFFGLPD